MSQSELLKHVVSVLDAATIPYMVTGSFASAAQGQPRATHDIDLVVAITDQQIPALIRAFPLPGYYLDEISIREAIAQNGMFNLLENNSGDKVDFWLVTGDPFDQSRFSRRYRETVAGAYLYLSSPEDTILQKLKWADLSGGSEKQFGDALRVFELQYAILDMAYLASWVDRLGIRDLWNRLSEEANPLE